MKAFTITEEEVRAWLPERDPAGHKGSFGHVLSVCGSLHYPGAAVLAALGAAHCGAGLVTAAFPECAYPAVAAGLTVSPLLPLPANRQGTFRVSALPPLRKALEGKNALLLGCGLGLNGDTKELVRALWEETELPIVLDADGINAAAAHMHVGQWKTRSSRALPVWTPHPGEMARLTGRSVEEIQGRRADIALEFARTHNAVLVLKGAGTVVASPERDCVYRCDTGNSGLAKGGSGDLLAGMLAALLAQGMDSFRAALCAVYLHGKAADHAAARYSLRGMTALDCVEALKTLLSEYE
ncbi:MAG: NAD(P)H-hydrate dehydratase [Oscillospiraceae bacterium]|nr:NAD(P)H-hydrate dehydratase [Oscillospiraceae bacterium]